MFNSIKEAAQNFCIHQIGTSCEIKEKPDNKRTLIAYIDIQIQNGAKYRIYIAPDINFIQKISEVFLEETQSDEETLKDMTLETANLIIGSAKVVAEESGVHYTIQTPHFERIGIFDSNCDEIQVFCINNDELIIASKELDA